MGSEDQCQYSHLLDLAILLRRPSCKDLEKWKGMRSRTPCIRLIRIVMAILVLSQLLRIYPIYHHYNYHYHHYVYILMHDHFLHSTCVVIHSIFLQELFLLSKRLLVILFLH